MLVFALDESRPFGERMASELGIALSEHEETAFPDGEHKARPLVSVRGRDVYVVQSLHAGPGASIGDKLLRLLFFLAAVRDSGAHRVTAVIPYLAFARQDRQTHPRDPLALRSVALLLEAVGVAAVVTVDVHNLAAFQNAFRCRTVHLVARREFTRKAMEIGLDDPVVVASPDLGGAKRAQLFGAMLRRARGAPVGLAFVEKQRLDGDVAGTQLAGDVKGAHVLVIDDMISTGATLVRASNACREHGARRIHAFATHGLFSGGAEGLLVPAGIEKIIVTDTVPPFRLSEAAVGRHVETVSVAPLFAAAVRRLHESGSLSELAFQE
ncbi:MAG: ribose-phosphate diphosphokinase [Hyphomicrobiaceae bacterium]|nr:ribose-phosphate diphosphokinase [Hyphomicrobiaceae bacterium]